MGRLSVDTCVWPLYEVTNGVYKVSKPREKKPVLDWLLMQGRFRHLSKPENKHILDEIQANIDANWQALLKKEAPQATA